MNHVVSFLKDTFFILLGIGMIIFSDKLGKAFVASDLAFWKAMNTSKNYLGQNNPKVLKISIITAGLLFISSGLLALFIKIK